MLIYKKINEFDKENIIVLYIMCTCILFVMFYIRKKYYVVTKK